MTSNRPEKLRFGQRQIRLVTLNGIFGIQIITLSVAMNGVDDNPTNRRELWQDCIYSCKMLQDYIDEQFIEDQSNSTG